MTILVTGVTGNVGRPLVDEVVERGADVRAAVRAERDDLPAGVPQVRFDFTDPTTWEEAFAGVRALFLLRPPQLADVGRDIAPALEAARAAGVEHVVFLSIQGAQLNPLVPHHAIERWLRRSGMGWTFLRAAYFMQNLTTTHAPELAAGEIFVPAGRARTALVDARDVATVAAATLLDPTPHAGRAYTITGPDALTYDECAAVLSTEWDRPVRYARPGVVRYCRTLAARGLPTAMIAVTVGLYTAARLGLAARTTDQTAALTGRPARDFRAFARDARPS